MGAPTTDVEKLCKDISPFSNLVDLASIKQRWNNIIGSTYIGQFENWPAPSVTNDWAKKSVPVYWHPNTLPTPVWLFLLDSHRKERWIRTKTKGCDPFSALVFLVHGKERARLKSITAVFSGGSRPDTSENASFVGCWWPLLSGKIY